MTLPASLIINSPFERPTHHWRRAGDSRLELLEGRRPAGYEVFDTRNNTVRTVALAQVNRIRERVDAWRAADYPGHAENDYDGFALCPGRGYTPQLSRHDDRRRAPRGTAGRSGHHPRGHPPRSARRRQDPAGPVTPGVTLEQIGGMLRRNDGRLDMPTFSGSRRNSWGRGPLSPRGVAKRGVPGTQQRPSPR